MVLSSLIKVLNYNTFLIKLLIFICYYFYLWGDINSKAPNGPPLIKSTKFVLIKKLLIKIQLIELLNAFVDCWGDYLFSISILFQYKS